MFTVVRGFVFITSLFLFANVFATEISESDVETLIAEVDEAVSQLDAQGVANTMSDAIEIVMHISVDGQQLVLRPNKAQYLAMLKEGWATYSHYEYKRTNLSIKIKGDKAFVTAKVDESMTVHGEHLSSSSNEELVIELVNGAPLITKAVGYTTM